MKIENSSQDDRIFQKLVEWLGILENHLTEIHEQRLVFEQVKDIVNANPNLNDNVFFEHLNLWYSSSISIAIRRLTDDDVKAVSYVRLLRLIASNPRAVSRSRIIQEWGGHELATNKFDEFVGVGEAFLPEGSVDADIKLLLAETKGIRDFADRYVAHNDARGLPKIPRFDNIVVALNSLERLHNKYASLFTGYNGTLTPVIAYPWKKIFTFPWISN